jgi:hypothetical protein
VCGSLGLGLGSIQIADGHIDGGLRALELLSRNNSSFDESRRPLKLAARLRVSCRGSFDHGITFTLCIFGGINAGVRFRTLPRIEGRERQGFHSRDQLVRLHRIAAAQSYPSQATGDRRGHYITISHASSSLAIYSHLHRPTNSLGDVYP